MSLSFKVPDYLIQENQCCLPAHVAQAVELITTEAPAWKTDKIGFPIILHYIGVAMQAATLDEFVTGLLHDSIEDLDNTRESLFNMGFPDPICQAVELLTRNPDKKQTYMEYIHSIVDSGNTLAIKVKYYDLLYNLDRAAASKFYSLENRYRTALAVIKPAADKL